ncbi:MAG: WecB/TagA/CpsF family glycosyltransferase, partial [Patescibacteria group bacterium]
GGAFDFLSGEAMRAPLFLQRAGLEWLWRLVGEPWRVQRIWNAVVLFPIAVIRERFKQKIPHL